MENRLVDYFTRQVKLIVVISRNTLFGYSDQLEPMKPQLASIMTNPDVHIELRIMDSLFRQSWESKINVRTMERLAELKIPLGISIMNIHKYTEEVNEFGSN